MLPAVTATRYVTPLREGGSLPGLMEADDLGTYVVKWRAAGQGVKVLVAEVVCGELARALSLPVPALVTVDVAPELAVGEPDIEVQELLQRSAGVNLGLDYLPGALDFEAGADGVHPELAGRVLWFDALIGNVDRSWRNPNMLFWHGRLQLIDHGATLTFHHNWLGAAAAVARSYDAAQHALIECSPDVRAADAALGGRVTRPLLEQVLHQAGPGQGTAPSLRGVGRPGPSRRCAPATSTSCWPGWPPATPGCRHWWPPRLRAGRAGVRRGGRTGRRGWVRRRRRG